MKEFHCDSSLFNKNIIIKKNLFNQDIVIDFFQKKTKLIKKYCFFGGNLHNHTLSFI